jgi:hypothetical protein
VQLETVLSSNDHDLQGIEADQRQVWRGRLIREVPLLARRQVGPPVLMQTSL